MEVIGAAASVLTIIDTTAKIISLYADVKNAREDIGRLRACTDNLKIALEGLQRLLGERQHLETSQKLQGALNDSYAQLSYVSAKLQENVDANKHTDVGKSARLKQKLRIGLRSLRWPFDSKDIERIIETLQRDQATFSSAVQIDLAAHVLRERIDLSALPIASGATFDSRANEYEPRYHPDTRRKVLGSIFEWNKDPNSRCIFWLCGMAGTGKSTISRTVAAHLHAEGAIVATYFFKKGEGDRGTATRFFSTIASQIANQVPGIGKEIQGAVEREPNIIDRGRKEQFDTLLLKPLEACKGLKELPSPITVVVDALDECESDDDVRAIIHLFSLAKESLTSTSLKFLVTSRPEAPPQLGFRKIGDRYTDLTLHQVPHSDIEDDIRAFLRWRLSNIRDDFNQSVPSSPLPSEWPSGKSVERLVEMAVPLFIVAATACLFIADSVHDDPEAQLDKILKFQGTAGFQKLHTTYLPILNQLLLEHTDQGPKSRSDNTKKEIITWFRELIPQRKIETRLRELQSVLDIPRLPSAPIKLLHLSFRDFLVNDENRDKNPFWIDERDTHARLASLCLQLLSTGGSLRRDICDMKLPGAPRSKLGPAEIDVRLPPEVQYACRHWVHHLTQSQIVLHDGASVHRFLDRHLLHWLEALALIGRITESITMIDCLLQSSSLDRASSLSKLLLDARRLILINRSVLGEYPLQVYHAALIFTPENSAIRKTFRDQYPSYMSRPPNIADEWDACLQSFETDLSAITSTAFSHAGNLLAVASGGIEVWNVLTGIRVSSSTAAELPFQECQGLTFSPDGRMLIAAGRRSHDERWRISCLDVASGSCISTLPTEQRILLVAFSRDGKWLATGSRNDESATTVHLYDCEAGWVVNKAVDIPVILARIAVIPSKDGIQLALMTHRKLTMWDIETDALIKTFEPGGRLIALSPDGHKVAIQDNHFTVRIYSISTGDIITTLQNDDLRLNSGAHFSSEGGLLITSSNHDRKTAVHIWEVVTGRKTVTFNDIIRGSHPSFSPDNCLVAVESGRIGTISLWDAGILRSSASQHSHVGLASSHMIVSRTSSRLVSLWNDGSFAAVWDVLNGRKVKDIYLTHSDVVWEGVHYAVLSPDEHFLALCDEATTTIWDLRVDKVLKTIPLRSAHVAFSSDGTLLAGVDHSRPGKLFNLEKEDEIVTFGDQSSLLRLAAFLQGRSRLLTISIEGHIQTWDPKTGTCLEFIPNTYDIDIESISKFLQPTILAVSATLDGEQVVTLSGKGDHIRIWDMSTKSCTARIDLDDAYIEDFILTATKTSLITNVGEFALHLPIKDQPGVSPSRAYRRGPGVSSDNAWVMWKKEKLIWLPPAYRPVASLASAVTNSRVVIGCESGLVLFMPFTTTDPLLLECS